VIVISEPVLGNLEEKLVLEVLRSGQLTQGPMVERFEDSVRTVVGTRHAVAVDNGTGAVIASLLAHGIGPGDEVVTSPFTFVATLNAILHVGATPRFVDIGDDFNLDPSLLREAIGPATRAVLPVHLYGCPADMEGIDAALEGRDMVVIEDAAQSLGATVRDRAVGSFGTGCFSFYATKNVTTGEGGVITTDNDVIMEALRIIRNQGQRALYDYDRPGFNLRMTELQAALGVAQMTRLEHPGRSEGQRARPGHRIGRDPRAGDAAGAPRAAPRVPSVHGAGDPRGPRPTGRGASAAAGARDRLQRVLSAPRLRLLLLPRRPPCRGTGHAQGRTHHSRGAVAPDPSEARGRGPGPDR
jgi:hypothetical protein